MRRRRRGEWDVVIARPIHHAVPAGMRWGQSRTTQLQPVLVCCARLHCVPTEFCCLLLDFLCSDALVFLPLHVFTSLLFSVPSCSVADFPFSFFFCYIFLNLLLKLSPQQFFELNISISYTFVVFCFIEP